MLRILAFACLANLAFAQSRVLVGNVVNAAGLPPAPVDKATVTLANTSQEVLTNNGRFQFALPPLLGAGSEVQIAVRAGNLRIYLPRNGVLTIPAPGARPVEVQLLPAGSKLFLEPAALEALLALASKPPLGVDRRDQGEPAEREPRLQRFLRQWSAEYGFGLEDVEREVRTWGDQVRANRDKASVRQRALAEFQAQRFAEAATLFEESASAEGAALERIERERRDREREEKAVLRRFLDDNIRAAEALRQGLKYAEAAQALERAAKRVDRERYAEWWAEMHARFGRAADALGSYGEGTGSIAALHTAVTAFRNALQVYTKASLPRKWAITFNNLGNVYQSIGERLSGKEGLDSLHAAVTAYHNALQVQTKESLPREWAMAQNNLGVAYTNLGERLTGKEGVDSLHAAVTAYRNALQVYTKESLPRDWAMTQNNLGAIYRSLAERLSGKDGANSLDAAVSAYQNALQVRTKELLPQEWAGTQNNLGIAYLVLGEQRKGQEGVDRLHSGVTAFQNALQVYTKESLPQDWARTQNNLGSAYHSLGERLSGKEGADSFKAGVSAYQNALQVYTKESLPLDWAMAQNNLGNAYMRLGERLSGNEGADRLQASVTAYQNALQVYTKESLPQDWAMTQNNLGTAYRILGVRLSGREGTDRLHAAVTAFQDALQVRTKDSLPQEWAMTQSNLGNAYQSLGERLSGQEGADSFQAALTAYENALQVQTKESLPQHWAATQNNLSHTLISLSKLAEAAQAAENALTVHPHLTERAEWIYHERLFRFDRAFELNTRRAELGEGEEEFVEKHLTTGRFGGCASRAAALLEKISDTGLRLGMSALRFACLAAEQKLPDSLAAGRDLRKGIAGLGKSGWTFSGTKHFLSGHPAFAGKAADWVGLFEALEEGDEAKAKAALTALGVPE